MMQLRDKRRFQNRLRHSLPIIAVFLVALGVLLYVFLMGGVASSDASYISFDQSGEVTLLRDGKEVSSVFLDEEDTRKIEEGNILIFEPEATPFFLWSFENGLYGYSNERKTLYRLMKKNDALEYEVLYSFSHLEIKDFKVENDIFYFVPADNSSVFSYNGKEFKPLLTGKYIESFDVKEGNVSVCAGDTLFLLGKGFSKSVYLGDRTFDILMTDTTIYVINNFGEEVGSALLHKFDYSLNSLGFYPIGNAGEIFFSENKIVSGQNIYDLFGEKMYTFEAPLSEIKSLGDFFYGREGDTIRVLDIKENKELWEISSSSEILLLI